MVIRGQLEVFSKSSDLDADQAIDNQNNGYNYPIEGRGYQKGCGETARERRTYQTGI